MQLNQYLLEMKRVVLPLFILLIGCFYSFGQTLISGQIHGEDGPVAFATVGLKGLSTGTSADEDGYFELRDLAPGSYTLLISAVGYRVYQQSLTLAGNEQLRLGQIKIIEDVLGLEEVVVTGTMKETFVSDSPIKVDVITSKFLEINVAPTNIVESIAMVNGVEEVIECGVCGTNSIRINGLEGPYTAVLMDGTPMFGNLASVYGLNGIPASIIDRIEVIKGPSSTLYGSEAVAGVINIITKDPAKQPLFTADVRGTTHKESFGNFGYAPKLGKWDGYVGLDYGYINDFHDANGDGFGDLVNMDKIALFTKWSRQRSDFKKSFIAAKYYFEDRRNGVEDFVRNRAYRQLRGSGRIYGESIYTNRFELFGTQEFGDQESFKLDFSLSHHRQNSYYGTDFYEAHQNIAYANLLWYKSPGNHQLVVGATMRYQNYDDNTVATERSSQNNTSNNPNNQFIPGVFAQDEWRPSEYFSLLTGSRLDYYQEHGLIFAPRLNAKFKPGDWTTFRLNFGTGFRIVNLFTEDHAFVTGQRTVEILEDLSPERSYNITLNFNHIYTLGNGQGTFDVDAFYTYFSNKIIPDYDTPGKIVYSNSDGHAISKGIGINLSQRFLFPLSINLGFTLQDVTQNGISHTGEVQRTGIEFAPRYSGTGAINYRWKQPDLIFAWSFNLTGPMQLPEVFDLDGQGQPLLYPRPTRSNPYSIHNFQLSKQFKERNFSIYAGLANIFDLRQRVSPLVGYNDPNTAVGFSDHFDTVYAYAPLHGREFYLGFRWNTGKRSK